jgi:hypothetical protein
MLSREEYIEQAFFFRALAERVDLDTPVQELLATTREEVLATTKLPMAIDFLLSELKHSGIFHLAMAQLSHYFSPFQTHVMAEAEDDRGRLDMRIALLVLRREAEYMAEGASPQGVFLYQFETLCRNRLRYDAGLTAMAADPIYDEQWRQWILTVRRRVGMIDLADMIYVRSQYYLIRQARRGKSAEPEQPILFGEKEGRIALANRRKEPMFLFAALQRQLGYPVVPRHEPPDDAPRRIPQILRLLEQFDARLKLMEEERRKGAINLEKFYGPESDD